MSRDLIDQFYLKQEEPTKSCLLALRDIVLHTDHNIKEDWQYGMPFFKWKKKRLCYFWKNRNTGHPYLGIVDGALIDLPQFEKGNRSRMKILNISPSHEIPIKVITHALKLIISHYRDQETPKS